MYDTDLKQSGAKISCHLLETNRVFAENRNESNFHVFYSLLFGSSSDDLKAIGLDRSISYNVNIKRFLIELEQITYVFQFLFLVYYGSTG